MRDALSILEETEARLAPLAVARNLAWWDSQIEATEENGERRVHAFRRMTPASCDLRRALEIPFAIGTQARAHLVERQSTAPPRTAIARAG